MTIQKHRLIFAGTPEFAATALKALVASDRYDLCAVYTQPDRPAGRGRKLQASAVKQVALDRQLPIYQPQELKSLETQQELQALDADLMIVAAYGLILPQAVLDIPRLGCLNIHASLLPRWRGAAPIQRAIAAGDKQTGISIMQMEAGLDTGPVFYKQVCPIDPQDTGGSLHDKLALLGTDSLMACLDDVLVGKLTPIAQDGRAVTYAEKLSKQEAQIDWQEDAELIVRKIHAFNPWPVAHGQVGDTQVRIWDAAVLDSQCSDTAGKIVSSSRQGIDVAAGQGIVRILRLQLPGKKALSVDEFANSNTRLQNRAS